MGRVLEIVASDRGIYENGKRIGGFMLVGGAMFVDKCADLRSCDKLILRDEQKEKG